VSIRVRDERKDALLELAHLRNNRGTIVASRSRIAAEEWNTDYRYDPANRLVQASQGQREANPQTSGLLMKTSASSDAQAQQWRYTPLGRRIALVAPHDAFGRQTHRSIERQGESVLQELVWNEAHQLVAIREQGRTVAEYRYDARGRRIAKTVTGASGKPLTTYAYYDDQHRLAAELDESGAVQVQYLYAGHVPYAVMRAEGAGATRRLYAIHADERGLPLAVTDDRQQVVWSARFDA
jgi:YD repeat-containing protein